LPLRDALPYPFYVLSGEATVSSMNLALQVNGEPHPVAAGCTVEELLSTLSLDGKRVAVAVNREVVPRSTFRVHALADGDRVEILEAVGGG